MLEIGKLELLIPNFLQYLKDSAHACTRTIKYREHYLEKKEKGKKEKERKLQQPQRLRKI